MPNFVEGLEQLLNIMESKRYNIQEQLIELEQHVKILGNAVKEMRGLSVKEQTETDNPYPTMMYVE